mmetsp:Transcript_50662/g.151547  ORF Transcript_50662/g.151547 Transcript_50662/m.151547 type:complete len:238 (-) Transcript_50662:729-1442(-)
MLLDDLEDLPKVKVGVLLHLVEGTVRNGRQGAVVGLEHVGQVEDGAAVAAVQHAGQRHALWQRPHQQLEDLVVAHESRRVVVDGAQALILAVGLVTVVVAHRGAVAAVVEEERVPGRGSVHEPPHGLRHGLPAGILVLAVVHEDLHAALAVSVVLEVAAHRLNVIVAAAELRAGADVVDADEQGPVVPAGLGVRDGEGRVEVHGPAAAQLRDLRVLAVEDLAHGLQQGDPGVVVPLA